MEGSHKPPGVSDLVCVIGSGAYGLVAIKNLVEQGLRVQAFEQNDHIGGIWHVTQDPNQTSALSGTQLLTSKQTTSFTDFPMPQEYHTHPSAKECQSYLEAYAQHFDIIQYIQFGTAVTNIKRDTKNDAWSVSTTNLSSGEHNIQKFSKVVLATGAYNTKYQPTVEGLEKFTGSIIHSQQLKDLTSFAGKNILVVGAGPTGADTLRFLEEVGASKLYLSLRSEFNVLPITMWGRPLDHYASRGVRSLLRTLMTYFPALFCVILNQVVRYVQHMSFPFVRAYLSPLKLQRSSGGLCYGARGLVFSDHLPYQLKEGIVKAVPELDRVAESRTVVLKDGQEITDLDAIIFCTGYHQDYSIIEGPGNPTDPAFAPDRFERYKQARFSKTDQPYPRLFYGILSERYPDSLAVLGHWITFNGTFSIYDLATMAIAALWSGSHPVPSQKTITAQINKRYDFVVRSLESGPMPYLGHELNDAELYKWMNLVAGTDVYERLETWKGRWGLWWSDKELYHLLLDGPSLPQVYRVFDTGRGRKPWAGARHAIERARQSVK